MLNILYRNKQLIKNKINIIKFLVKKLLYYLYINALKI